MASGILESLKKVSFVKDAFYLREWKDKPEGCSDSKEYMSQKGVIVRELKRKDRGIKDSFKNNGYTAPNLNMSCYSEGTRNQSNRQKNIKNGYQARTSKGDER